MNRFAAAETPHLASEASPNYSGLMQRARKKDSLLTSKRKAYERELSKEYSNNSNALSSFVTNYLIENLQFLVNWIRYKGYTVATNPLSIISQAAILKIDEIGYLSQLSDTDFEDALKIIEQSEYEALNDNLPDSEFVLPPDVQAALMVVVKRMLKLYKSKGGSGDVSDLRNVFRIHSQQEDGGIDPIFIVGENPVYSGSHLSGDLQSTFPDAFDSSNANAWGIDFPVDNDAADMIPKTGETTNKTFGAGIFDFLDNLFDSANKFGDTVKKVSGDIRESQTNIASKLGIDVIKENWPLLLGILLIVALIIFLAIYASRNK